MGGNRDLVLGIVGLIQYSFYESRLCDFLGSKNLYGGADNRHRKLFQKLCLVYSSTPLSGALLLRRFLQHCGSHRYRRRVLRGYFMDRLWQRGRVDRLCGYLRIQRKAEAMVDID